MKNRDYFRNKKVTVIGIARSGFACAKLLRGLGAKVSVTDVRDDSTTRDNAMKLKAEDIAVELGSHSQGFIKDRDIVIVSPGVPQDALPLIWARQYRIPIISEIECAWLLCPATVIAVTGSNGKTTVTTLIGKILQESGRRSFVCGNIGTPLSQEVIKMQEGDFVSLEVSSFQLETIREFKPFIAVILNFSRNHLDRYKNMEEYLQAKKRIFMNQDSRDWLVLNYRDPIAKALSYEAASRIVYFNNEEEPINPNLSAVSAVGSILSINKELINKVFSDFKGVEHRMEYVACINGVTFINDSKSTTVDSCLWALRNISMPVILIAGGRDKGNDYSILRQLAAEKLKGLIVIGEAKGKIKCALEGVVNVEEAATLETAVKRAFEKAHTGDCVLLSPMCSSFDMFKDYEERGRVFKRVVASIS